jgi:hypothetical protein
VSISDVSNVKRMETAGKAEHAARKGNASVRYYLALKLTILILGAKNMKD